MFTLAKSHAQHLTHIITTYRFSTSLLSSTILMSLFNCILVLPTYIKNTLNKLQPSKERMGGLKKKGMMQLIEKQMKLRISSD